MSNDLSLVVNFSAIDKLTKPYQKITKTNSKFSKGVIKTATELDKLKKAQSKVANFQKLEKRLSKGANTADKYKAELKDLKTQIRSTSRPTKKLTNAYARKQRQLTTLIDKNKQYKRDLGASGAELAKTGVNTRKLGTEQQRLTKRINTTSQALKKQVKQQERMRKLGRGAKRAVATAVGTSIAAGATARSFTSNENADADLRIALLNKKGQLPADLLKIQSQAKILGNRLPGTTADFFNVARTLSEQGVAAKLIANGGLKSASELAVVLNLIPEEAARMAAKAKEAFGLSAHELEKMADLTQRAKFQFGLTPDDLGEANKYVAPTLNALKITGISNAKLVLAIEGLAAQKGLEGSSFGTSLARFLDGATTFSENISKKSNASQLETLNSKGLKFDFFNDKGKFRGLEHAVRLTESWKGALNDQDFANLIDKMFGDRGKRVAEIVASSGVSGFRTAQQNIDNQASIQQRIGVKMSTLTAKAEATTGSLSNLAATLFEPISKPLKSALEWANKLIGATDSWLSNDNKLGKYSASLLAVAGTLKISSLGTSALLGTASAVAPSATLAIMTKLKSLKIFKWVFKLRAGLGFLAGKVGLVLRLLPLLLTPWGLIGLAVTGLAVTIYKNWDWIKTTVGEGVAYLRLKITDGLEFLANTKDRWYQNGKDMIGGLIDGIKSAPGRLAGAVKDIAIKPVVEFKKFLGIKSPSKVFAKLGGNLSEGVAVGIQAKAPLANRSVANFARKLPAKLPALALAASIASAPQLAAADSPQNQHQAPGTFAPVITININSSSNASAQDIGAAVRRELENAMKSAQQNYNSRLFD